MLLQSLSQNVSYCRVGPGSLKCHPCLRPAPPTGEATWGWGEKMGDIWDYGPRRKCMKKSLSWEGCKKYHVASVGQRKTLRKQPTFGDATRLRNQRRNSILVTCHYSDLGSASDLTCREGSLPQPITSTTSDLGSDTLSVWNFCARFVDVISRGNQW